jgi:ParB family chromosome partitioning protein
MTNYNKGQLYQIPLADLQADPNQPRKVMDAQSLDELAATIQKHGVLEPILFRVDSEGGLYVVAGERRLAASRLAGLDTIPAIAIEGNYSEIALVENLLRQDLTAIEEAEGLQALMIEQEYTQEQMGGIIGKAQNTLSEILSLNKLPQEIRDDCRGDRTISKSALIAIARKKQERSMTTAYNAYKAKLQKVKTTRQKKNPNDPQAVIDMVDKTITKLQAVDPSEWSEEDLENYRTSLNSLEECITDILSPPSRDLA